MSFCSDFHYTCIFIFLNSLLKNINFYLNDFPLFSLLSFFDIQMNELIIQTVETARQQFFLERFVARKLPVLFVGPTGTGKSAITNAFLFNLPKKKYIICNISFSARTSSNQTQDIIFSKLDRYGGLYSTFILAGRNVPLSRS